jgi:hypothetical protein
MRGRFGRGRGIAILQLSEVDKLRKPELKLLVMQLQ